MFIKKSDLLEKYKYFLTEMTLRNILKNHPDEITTYIDKKDGKTIFINEEEFKKQTGLYNKDLSKYKKLSDIIKEYNISSKAINDYYLNNQIEEIRFTQKIILVNEDDVKKVLPLIIKNRYKQNKENDPERRKEIEKRIDERLGKDYKRLDHFIKMKSKIKVLHKLCGQVSLLTPDNIVNGNHACGCPICYGTRKYTQEEVQDLIHEYLGNDYKLCSEYKSNKSYIKISHQNPNCKNHGQIYSTKLNTILYKRSGNCPYCNNSSGENLICNFLNNNDISYETQYTFDNYSYKYDFFIPSLNLVIEYDGKQHFEPIFGYGEEHKKIVFKENQKRDRLKTNIILTETNFSLLRISYFNKDIEKILKDILINHKLSKYDNKIPDYYEYILENKNITFSDKDRYLILI